MELKNLRSQLIPLSIIQSMSSMASKIIPYFLFKFHKRNYFKYLETHKNRNES